MQNSLAWKREHNRASVYRVDQIMLINCYNSIGNSSVRNRVL